MERVNFKELKTKGRAVLKTNYRLYVGIVLISAFLGVEYASNLELTKLGNGYWNKINTFVNSFGGKGAPDNSRGVFASMLTALKRSSIFDIIGQSIGSMFKADDTKVMIGILVSAILALGFYFLVQSVYKVPMRRIFLEGRVYEKTDIRRLLFLNACGKYFKVAVSLIYCEIILTLWWLTIIGGIYKSFQYNMVPYILAENPDIGGKKAIQMSKEMMKGHVFELFKLEFSFIGWAIVGVLTWGLSDIFYVSPYRMATFTEYYVKLREEYINQKKPDYELLNDTYLYEKASKDVLNETYSDVVSIAQLEPVEIKYKNKFAKFMGENFGISVSKNQNELEFEQYEFKKRGIMYTEDCMRAESYPQRLCPIQYEEYFKPVSLLYIRHYSINSLILLFFCLSFVGWAWEFALHLVEDGVFVNRGTMWGPWLPIYGFGCVFILTLLYRFRKKPLLEFVSAIILCGVLEYFAHYYLEITNNGTRWWDYTGYVLNLHGRICAEGLLVFGVGGMAFVYFLAPMLDNVFRKVNKKVLIPITVALCIVFAGDFIYSSEHPNGGKGITDYDEVIKREVQGK